MLCCPEMSRDRALRRYPTYCRDPDMPRHVPSFSFWKGGPNNRAHAGPPRRRLVFRTQGMARYTTRRVGPSDPNLCRSTRPVDVALGLAHPRFVRTLPAVSMAQDSGAAVSPQFSMARPRFLRLPGGLPAVSHGLPAVWLTRVFLWLTCGSPARAYMTGTAVLIDTLLAWALLLHLLVAAVSGCRNAV